MMLASYKTSLLLTVVFFLRHYVRLGGRFLKLPCPPLVTHWLFLQSKQLAPWEDVRSLLGPGIFLGPDDPTSWRKKSSAMVVDRYKLDTTSNILMFIAITYINYHLRLLHYIYIYILIDTLFIVSCQYHYEKQATLISQRFKGEETTVYKYITFIAWYRISTS